MWNKFCNESTRMQVYTRFDIATHKYQIRSFLTHFSVWFSKPAVSIGNVGQLAVDLVVSAVCPDGSSIGYLYDSCVLPVVGNDAFTLSTEASGKLNVSVEGLNFLYCSHPGIFLIYSPFCVLDNLCKLVFEYFVLNLKEIFITSLHVCLCKNLLFFAHKR